MRAILLAVLLGAGCATDTPEPARSTPYLIVLGNAQDGGAPQTGNFDAPGWEDRAHAHRVASLGLVDPETGQRWLFDATPDFPSQLRDLALEPPTRAAPGVDGIFLTHAHIGHYTGLMFLGHESMGAQGVPVYALPRLVRFLEDNGPWSQLVAYENIRIRAMVADSAIQLSNTLSVTPLEVPHRQEYAEVAGFLIQGPSRSALFIPDIDAWTDWDRTGTRLEDMLARVDAAYLDGTFFANGEIPGRDMSGFPHPFIRHTLDRLEGRPDLLRRVRFIHLNHTNPALDPNSAASNTVEDVGAHVARDGERFGL